VDIENCKTALLRATELLKKHASAEYVRLIESPVPVVEHPKITLHFQRLEKLLGLVIEPDIVAKILKKLGFRLEPTKEVSSVVVAVPSFRQEDITREVDLIEEVIRIYGYDKVPYTLPMKTGTSILSLRARMITELGRVLRAQGLQEVVTTSLIGPNLLEKTGFTVNEQQLVSVVNSHSSDHTMMRQSLLPNIIEVAKFNQSQGLEDIWIYELGRMYRKLGKANAKHSGVSESLMLGGLITGSVTAGGWSRKEPADFYLLKGILENLFSALNVESIVSFEATDQTSYLHPGKAAFIKIGDAQKELGVLGELHPEVQKSLKFRQPVYLFEFNVEVLYKVLKQQNQTMKVAQLSHYPAIKRDMAFLAPTSLSNQSVIQVLKDAKEPLLRQVELFDDYRSKQLGADKRSLAYRLTFQSDDATLTDADADQRLSKLKEVLSQKLPIQFR
jgi:phenylalanyl-tRNA synthetase beta chain